MFWSVDFVAGAAAPACGGLIMSPRSARSSESTSEVSTESLGRDRHPDCPVTLSHREAAEFLGISQRQLDRLPIKRYRAGKRKWLFYLRDLENHLAKSEFCPGQPTLGGVSRPSRARWRQGSKCAAAWEALRPPSPRRPSGSSKPWDRPSDMAPAAGRRGLRSEPKPPKGRA